MASTIKTPNYNLPAWNGSDKPAFLQDLKPAFATIDTEMKKISDKANEGGETLKAQVELNTADIELLKTEVSGATSDITNLGDSLALTEKKANDTALKVGTGTLETKEKSIVPAVNELNTKNILQDARLTDVEVEITSIVDKMGGLEFRFDVTTGNAQWRYNDESGVV